MKETISQEALDRINKMIDETISEYYRTHNYLEFFRIDEILGVCRKYELTTNEIPRLIEMQNIILMG